MSFRPKVLVVIPRLDIGGTETHIARTVPELRQRGIDASLFVFRRGGKLEKAVEKLGVPLYGPPKQYRSILRSAYIVWTLKAHIRRARPDILHFFLPEAYLLGSAAAILAGVKCRIMSRRSLAHYQKRHRVLAILERVLHRYTMALLGNSRAVVDELRDECSSPEKLGLIYNGMRVADTVSDAERLKFRCGHDLSPSTFIIIIVANLISYKGHQDLLRALALASSRLPKGWRLFAVGRDDGAGAELGTLAANLGLTEHIVWTGEVPNTAMYFRAADLAILCSHQEGFANSLIEAMAHGLAVVATAVGGNLDAVVSHQTGILVPVGAPSALADAIVTLSNDSDLRATFGVAAQRRVAQYFSSNGTVQRYANLYKLMLKGSHRTIQSMIDCVDESISDVTLPAKDPRHRVLHIIPDLGIGGAETVLSQLVTSSDSAKGSTTVASLLPGGFYIEQLRAAGVNVAVFDMATIHGMVAALTGLVRLIWRERPRIVQGWMYYGDLVALLALYLSGRRRATRLVWTIRCSNLEFELYQRKLHIVTRICAALSRLPDAIIANSSAGLNSHIEGGYRPRLAAVIANGVDVDRFKRNMAERDQFRSELGIEKDAIVLVHVARVDPMKDHHTALAAAELVQSYHLLLVGDGTQELVLPMNVRALGVRTDLPRILSAGDFIISSSAFGEGFSNSIAEGMACELPAVATDVGDAKFIVGDTGVVVPPSDPKALAEAIVALAEEPLEARARRGTLARDRIIDNFSLDKFVKSIARLHEDVLGDRR